MAPYCHIYIGTEVLRSHDWNVVLGSVTPDIGIILIGTPGFKWEIGDGEKTASKLLNLTKTRFPDLQLFGAAYALHTVGFEGADFYSDGERHDGFAYKLGEPLITRIEKELNITKELATTFSHNFIEMALDVIIVQECPGLPSLLASSINTERITQISEPLSLATGYPESFYHQALSDLCGHFLCEKLVTVESVSRQYAKVISKISVESDNGKDLENIVEEALEICTTKNALRYLEEAKEKMEITVEALTE